MSADRRFPALVVFDVDGTLQNTMAWWPDCAARGVRDFGERIGVELPLPSRELAASVVGLADEDVWSSLLPHEHRARWRDLRDLVVPIECEILRSGDDFLFAGTRELLEELCEAGSRIALASNCRAQYFAAVLEGQGLGAYVDEAWCLDSPDVETKTCMLRNALASAGLPASAAVMVGDRDSDQRAAAGLGLRFVLRCGFHEPSDLPADAHASTQAEILEVLAGLET